MFPMLSPHEYPMMYIIQLVLVGLKDYVTKKRWIPLFPIHFP